MNENLYITNYSIIEDNSVNINGKVDFTSDKSTFKDFIKEAYRHYNIKYPKFFKMDNQCKLAFIGAEIVFNQFDISNFNKEKIGIVMMNRASSLDVDREHQKSIDNKESYFPSPAVFVYTLANIMVGEIAIKNKIQGENMSFVSDFFDSNLLFDYINCLFNSNKIELCLCGWVDFDTNNYKSVQFLIAKNNSKNLTFEPNTLNTIFKTNK